MLLDKNPIHRPPTFKLATLVQTNPVQNTWYTVLDTTLNVIIYWMTINILVADETLQWRITIDGETSTPASLACTFGTTYYCYLTGNPTSFLSNITATGAYHYYRSFQIIGRSIKIEVRKTTAGGAGDLNAQAFYGEYE